MKNAYRIMLATVILIGILLCGCTNGGLTRKVSMSKLMEDIAGNPQIQSCFTSDYVNESQYTVDTIEIVKEQENEKEIITYSDIVLKNAYFSVSLYIKTIYNYYDHGGWIMDGLYIEEVKHIIPVSGPDPNCVAEYIAQESIDDVVYQDEEMNLSNIGSDFDVSITETALIDTTTAHAIAHLQTNVTAFEGYFVFTFDENGWVPEDWTVFHITDFTADYSSQLGRYVIDNDKYSQYGIDNYTIYDEFDIEILSIEGTTVTYNLESFSRDRAWGECDVVLGRGLKAEFDPLKGQFCIGSYEYTIDNNINEAQINVYYSAFDKVWHVENYALKKSP